MTDREALIERINSASFTVMRMHSSYDMTHVDDFLDALVVALRQDRPVGPLVDMVQFSTARFRDGYDAAEVDHFLDQVAADSQLVAPEPGGTGPAGASSPAPTTQDAAPASVAHEGSGEADRTGSPEEAWTPPDVIEEQRGLLSRLFRR